jgi:tRNA 2-thiouridine synthesizing protein C
MSETPKRTLLVCRHSPYQGQLSRGALDIALAASVFEQDISVLFMDEGVWQLLPGQDTQKSDNKSIEKTLASFDLYDLKQLYVEETSMSSRLLSSADMSVAVEAIEAHALPDFMNSFQQVISC